MPGEASVAGLGLRPGAQSSFKTLTALLETATKVVDQAAADAGESDHGPEHAKGDKGCVRVCPHCR